MDGWMDGWTDRLIASLVMIHWLRCLHHQWSLRTSKVYHLQWLYRHRGRNCQRTPPPRKSILTHLLHFVNTEKGTSKCFHSRRKIQRKREEIRPSCSSDHGSVPRPQKQVFPADVQAAFPKWTWLTLRPLENTCLAEKRKKKKKVSFSRKPANCRLLRLSSLRSSNVVRRIWLQSTFTINVINLIAPACSSKKWP